MTVTSTLLANDPKPHSGSLTDAIAVVYLIDGERTATAVAGGESRLVGMSLGVHGQPSWSTTGGVHAALQAMGPISRIYEDAIFARTVERTHGLPTVANFDDLRVMRRLLECAGQPCTGGFPSDPTDRVASLTGQREVLWAQLSQLGLTNVYANIELPIVDAVVDMIIHGMPCDTTVLAQIEDDATAHRDILRYRLITEFGITKPDDTQQQLAGNHPARPCLREYWSLGNTLTMCESLLDKYCDRTGCVHGELDPLGADTGRFSCAEPNLLGVPHPVRHAIRARPGHTLVEADISQAELRVLAHFSRDPGLVEAFRAGNVDLHAHTAALLGDGDTADRKIGKAVNFGIAYGETEYGLSDKLGVSVEKARGYIDNFFQGHPAVYDWIETVKSQVRYHGYVQTLFGRRRSLPEIWLSGQAVVAKAERQAVNTAVQGTAADLMKIILARLYHSLPEGCRMLVAIHDSVLLEVPSGQTLEVKQILQETMEAQLPGFSIPIRVDVNDGEDWGACKPP